MSARAALAAFLLASAVALPALAQTVKLGPVPTPQETRKMTPRDPGAGFNAANAAQVAVGRTVRIEQPPLLVQAVMEEPPAGSLAAHVEALRRRAAADTATLLDGQPAAARARLEAYFGPAGQPARSLAWQAFFAGAVTVAGAMSGDSASAYLFNPVYDGVAVLGLSRTGGGWRLDRISLVAGERLRTSAPALAPAWTESADGPFSERLLRIAVLTRIWLARGIPHDIDDRDLILARILRLQLGLARETDSGRAAVRALLEALASGEPAALRRAGLDAGTASGLERFPAELRRELVALGGVVASDGLVAVYAASARPGLVYLIGIPAKRGAPNLTPVPTIIVSGESRP